MMAFQISNETRKYFQKINDKSTTGQFEIIWDYYYLCLMVGFRNGELCVNDGESSEFINEFPRLYRSNRYQIISALILSEINRQGLAETDSAGIRKLMLELLDKDEPTNISNEGLKRMNMYAEQGFILINEKIPQLYEMSDFIKRYYEEFIEIDY